MTSLLVHVVRKIKLKHCRFSSLKKLLQKTAGQTLFSLRRRQRPVEQNDRHGNSINYIGILLLPPAVPSKFFLQAFSFLQQGRNRDNTNGPQPLTTYTLGYKMSMAPARTLEGRTTIAIKEKN